MNNFAPVIWHEDEDSKYWNVLGDGYLLGHKMTDEEFSYEASHLTCFRPGWIDYENRIYWRDKPFQAKEIVRRNQLMYEVGEYDDPEDAEEILSIFEDVFAEVLRVKVVEPRERGR